MPTTLEAPETANPDTPTLPAGIVREQDQPNAMSCPVCGSGSTYQLPGGRWGCTQCHSSWG